MTSALRGGEGVTQTVMISCVTMTVTRGAKKSHNFTDVINGWSLILIRSDTSPKSPNLDAESSFFVKFPSLKYGNAILEFDLNDFDF